MTRRMSDVAFILFINVGLFWWEMRLCWLKVKFLIINLFVKMRISYFLYIIWMISIMGQSKSWGISVLYVKMRILGPFNKYLLQNLRSCYRTLHLLLKWSFWKFHNLSMIFLRHFSFFRQQIGAFINYNILVFFIFILKLIR